MTTLGLFRFAALGSAAPVVIDPDATAFLSAAGITDPTVSTAVHKLADGMKKAGVWNLMQAIYPMAGGTAATHKWNLKDPRDVNAAFRLLFNGVWTHSATGAKPNGAAASYANPFYNMSVNSLQNDFHMSYYARTALTLTGVPAFLMGWYNTTSYATELRAHVYPPNSGFLTRVNTSHTGAYAGMPKVTLDNRAFVIGSRTSSTETSIYVDGVLGSTDSSASIAPANGQIFIGARNTNPIGTSDYPTTQECAFASIGRGLNGTQAAALHNLVTAFNTALGRAIQ
ncbi:MAG TPA: hypothetical protein VNS29_15240 [Burkholderiaceae bacterium]|nr:hypothetical protein [Burkholderiaceae bacterium]